MQKGFQKHQEAGFWTKSRYRKTWIDKDDLKGLSQLLSAGFSFPEAMNLIETKENRKLFDKIRFQLAEGNAAEDFFVQYVPRRYGIWLSGFLKYCSFETSLAMAVEITESSCAQRQKTFRALFYPCMLMGASLCGIILFNELCFPPLLSMMDSFHVSSASFAKTRIAVRAACIAFSAALAVLLSALIWFLQKHNMVKGYKFICSILPDSIVTQTASVEFVRFFLACLKADLPTKKSLMILKGMKEAPVCSYIAGCLDKALENGSSFSASLEMADLDPALTRFMKIAIFSSSMESMLESYLSMSASRLQRQCRKLTSLIQLFSYTSIGIILILVYQVLMVPLQILMQV